MVELPWDPDILNVAAWRLSRDTLGPGQRLCVWLQGCLKNCTGCMARAWQPLLPATFYSPKEFAEKISSFQFDGITLSGGEPFLQAQALSTFLDLFRTPDVIAFSGYYIAELYENSRCKKLLDKLTILIDGPFDESMSTIKGLRGSSNQNIHQLNSGLNAYSLANCKRKIEIIPEQDGTMVVGIPEKRLWHGLQEVFKKKI